MELANAREVAWGLDGAEGPDDGEAGDVGARKSDGEGNGATEMRGGDIGSPGGEGGPGNVSAEDLEEKGPI